MKRKGHCHALSFSFILFYFIIFFILYFNFLAFVVWFPFSFFAFNWGSTFLYLCIVYFFLFSLYRVIEFIFFFLFLFFSARWTEFFFIFLYNFIFFLFFSIIFLFDSLSSGREIEEILGFDFYLSRHGGLETLFFRLDPLNIWVCTLNL